MDYLGEKGFAATMTCQRNRLPKGVEDCFLHKEKTVPGCKVARVARFNKPITLVKTTTKMKEMPVIPEDGAVLVVQPTEVTWTRVHVTFQSTSSTNLSTVNALNANQLFVRTKERGRGDGKRQWAIEMNEGRQLYLNSYGRVDTIDSLIKHCNMFYCSWKYWHACKLHVQALGLVAAYDMFLEVLQEGFAEFGFASKQEAKSQCFLDFHQFRDKLSLQGLHYDPEDKRYPGDSGMRVCTKKRKATALAGGEKRGRGRPRLNTSVTPSPEGDDNVPDPVIEGKVTLKQLNHAKRALGRLCLDVTKLLVHKSSVVAVKYPLRCRYCGDKCYSRCTVCNMPCHDNPRWGNFKGRQCFTELHNVARFGLAKCDCGLINKDKNDWRPPTEAEKQENARHVEEIQRKRHYALRIRVPTVEEST